LIPRYILTRIGDDLKIELEVSVIRSKSAAAA
jgi:hypothetical protein